MAATTVTRPGANDSWTGVPRSATSDTRRTASVNIPNVTFGASLTGDIDTRASGKHVRIGTLAGTDVTLTIAGQELKLGVVTAMLGCPFFLWLIVRGRARAGS